MKFLEKGEIDGYVTFLKQYYPFSELELCVLETSEREWKHLYTSIQKGKIMLERVVKEGVIESYEVVEIHESHGSESEMSSYKDAMGYYIPTNNLINIVNFWQGAEIKKLFLEKLENTEYFIMLRMPQLRDREIYLETLFHEILHAIEIKSQQKIYRGSSIQQEARDTEEISLPLVREYIRQERRRLYRY